MNCTPPRHSGGPSSSMTICSVAAWRSGSPEMRTSTLPLDNLARPAILRRDAKDAASMARRVAPVCRSSRQRVSPSAISRRPNYRAPAIHVTSGRRCFSRRTPRCLPLSTAGLLERATPDGRNGRKPITAGMEIRCSASPQRFSRKAGAQIPTMGRREMRHKRHQAREAAL